MWRGGVPRKLGVRRPIQGTFEIANKYFHRQPCYHGNPTQSGERCFRPLSESADSKPELRLVIIRPEGNCLETGRIAKYVDIGEFGG